MKTKTPELDKMLVVRVRSQAIGEFLEWLADTKGYGIYSEDDAEDQEGNMQRLYFRAPNTEQLLAEYFEIDLKKVEKERRAILKELQGVK